MIDDEGRVGQGWKVASDNEKTSQDRWGKRGRYSLKNEAAAGLAGRSERQNWRGGLCT